MNNFPEDLCAPMELLLGTGADERSQVDRGTGLNLYGCTRSPRPNAISYSSSTASSISQGAFDYVQNQRGLLLRSRFQESMLDEHMELLREELKGVLGLAETGTDIIFSPSGTDSVLHGLCVARALKDGRPLDCILVASDETGSSVPAASAGRHFGNRTAEGIAVSKGAPIVGLASHLNLISIAVRDASGIERSLAELDQAVFDAVSRSVRAERGVLVQAMDSSKLGSRCPSDTCLEALHIHFGPKVQVIVDACQLRISLPRIKHYLDCGHMVVISGSKFFTGPAFSGALLVPESLAVEASSKRCISEGLRDYTYRAAWPAAWKTLRKDLLPNQNFGPYFRWTAALYEMRAYYSVPANFRHATLEAFDRMVTDVMMQRSLDVSLLRMPWNQDSRDDPESRIRTLFPFYVRQGNRPTSFEDTVSIYRALNEPITLRSDAWHGESERELAARICHIGQPIRMSDGVDGNSGALRLCAGSRTVTDIWARNRGTEFPVGIDSERIEVETILDKIKLISRHAARIYERAA